MLTTHILDTAKGRPAAQVKILVEKRQGESTWDKVGEGTTDADGRAKDLAGSLERAHYRLTFMIADYYADSGRECFYPEVSIAFKVEKPEEHFHVPLLISGFGFSTYRGS